jgi:DNA-binding NarL/FixJ family response regulator
MHLLLIDSSPLLLEGLASMLAKEYPGCRLSLASDAASFEQESSNHFMPGLSIVDMEFKAMHYTEVVRQLRSRFEHPRILLASQDPSWENVLRALELETLGVVDKCGTSASYTSAINISLQGTIHIPNGMKGTQLRSASRRLEQVGGNLTRRQQDVLELLALGKSNKQICRILGMAEGTVKNHINAMFRQLGVRNRTEAALLLARPSTGHITPAGLPPAPQLQGLPGFQ